MEQYQGLKFTNRRRATTLPDDPRLARLNHWAWVFAQLGLAPSHSGGAYGNQSCRTGPESFLITRAGMQPAEKFQPENFCHVVSFSEAQSCFITEGVHPPSSESYLHYRLYQALPAITAILHGHCPPLNDYAEQLAIPVTPCFQPYGTRELAEDALALVKASGSPFFILCQHGFVALGEDIDIAGHLALDSLVRLIRMLRDSSPFSSTPGKL
jgi:L-ribulose-5-phosphate 4-epimerase